MQSQSWKLLLCYGLSNIFVHIFTAMNVKVVTDHSAVKSLLTAPTPSRKHAPGGSKCLEVG